MFNGYHVAVFDSHVSVHSRDTPSDQTIRNLDDDAARHGAQSFLLKRDMVFLSTTR